MVQLDVRQSFLFEIFFAVFLNDKLEEFSLVVGMVHKNARQVFNSDPLIFLEFKPLVLGILKGPMGCIINQSSDHFFDDCHHFIRVGGLDCLTAGISKRFCFLITILKDFGPISLKNIHFFSQVTDVILNGLKCFIWLLLIVDVNLNK